MEAAIEVPPTAWLREFRKMKDVIVRVVDCVRCEDGYVTHLITRTIRIMTATALLIFSQNMLHNFET